MAYPSNGKTVGLPLYARNFLSSFSKFFPNFLENYYAVIGVFLFFFEFTFLALEFFICFHSFLFMEMFGDSSLRYSQ